MASFRSPCPAGAISVIVPSWDLTAEVSLLAEKWAALSGVREVIVCIAQSSGAPAGTSLPSGCVKVCGSSETGRGFQMNAGAALASGDILLFHHADSLLTQAHIASLSDVMREAEIIGGAYYRKFDERHPYLRWLERLERLHLRLFGTLYGDQSIFVRRSHFQGLGGFARIPLIEDVEFSGRLRRSGPVVLLDPPMQTSARKHKEEGAWKVTLQNILFLILFRCGADPERLHAWYYSMSRKIEKTVSLQQENPTE